VITLLKPIIERLIELTVAVMLLADNFLSLMLRHRQLETRLVALEQKVKALGKQGLE
jgi:hypothetical protein